MTIRGLVTGPGYCPGPLWGKVDLDGDHGGFSAPPLLPLARNACRVGLRCWLGKKEALS